MSVVVHPRKKAGKRRKSEWPKLPPEAFHGLAGRFVQALDPHTEADPGAVLIQVLTAFGSCIGRGLHFRAEADRHFTNMFAVLVGETSKARKGSSWSRVFELFHSIDEKWATTRVMEGLSSGEGLIWQVRDEVTRINAKGEEEVVVEGVDDKRLLIVESEFAGLLKVLRREGNTLSPLIRRAWDRGDLESLTKNSPARATGAHISIVGHITTHELHRYLTETEAASGFGNRHLFCCVRRSKCLPDGGRWTEDEAAPFRDELAEVVEFCRTLGDFELCRDEEAGKIWHTVYPDLSEGRPGMAGALTARAEAQVMRLALLYALLDKDIEIEPVHLHAALALWEYCASSVTYVFGNALGDPVADTILHALEDREALTRTEIRDIFGRHAPRDLINHSFATLAKLGLIESFHRKTRGRPVEVWRLKEET